jgi:hypothetical protein
VLLGWLYVGGKPETTKADARQTFDVASAISTL